MIPDRMIGALCLGVAAVVATAGTGAVERSQRAAISVETATLSQGGAGDPVPDPVETTTTTLDPLAGAGPGASSSTTTTTASVSTTTTTSAPPSAEAEMALANRALLVAPDLPPGFTKSREAPQNNGEGPFERCLGAEAGSLTAAVRAKAASPEFIRADTGTISTTSAVLDQPPSAEKVMAVLGTPEARKCFENLINARLARNPKLSNDVRGTISPLDAGPYGDQTTGFRFEVRLPAEDVEKDPPEGEKEILFVADFLFVRKARTLVVFEFGSLRHPFPAADANAIAKSVAGHI